jgi:hypothetical protein
MNELVKALDPGLLPAGVTTHDKRPSRNKLYKTANISVHAEPVEA